MFARKWLYRGRHRADEFSITVDDVRASLRAKPDPGPVYLGSIFKSVRFYGIVSDSDPVPETATLVLASPEAAATSIAPLIEPADRRAA